MHAPWAVALVATLIVSAPAAAAPKAAKAKERPLPGFPGLVYRDLTLPDACTKQGRAIRQVKKGADAALVKLLTWPRITGLDFPPDDEPRRSASMARFEAWYQGLSDLARQVADRQGAVARDPARTPVARVEAMARLAVAEQQLVDLIGSVDVPRSIRAVPDAGDMFCDRMFEQSEPLQLQLDQIRGACRQLIVAGNVGEGWWTEACRMPDDAAPPARD